MNPRQLPALLDAVPMPKAALLLFLALPGCAAAPVGYSFFLDGQPCTPSFTAVEGTPGSPREGDLLSIGGGDMVLDAPGAYHFETDPAHREAYDRRLWRVDGGTRRLVAMALERSDRALDLTAGDWATLRGLEFQGWDAAMAPCLLRVDAARCLLSFTPMARFPELPPLPRALRYLDLHWAEGAGFVGVQELTDLRLLRVPAKTTIATVDFAARLTALRYLDLEGTAVRDLTPLGGHPSLRTVLAPCTPIERLPDRGMTALRQLVAYASGCPEVEAARFAALVPAARVVVTCRAMLLEAVAGAVRLRIRTGSTCHPSPEDREVHVTERAEEIAQLLELLRPEEDYSPGWVVPGCGQFTLEFQDARGRLLLEVGLLGTGCVRSGRIWNTPVMLAHAVCEPLREWLRARGAAIHD